MTLGTHIVELRREAHLTQEELARQMSVTRQAISRWERDDAEPDISTLKRLAEVFGVPVTLLLDLPEGGSWCQSCGMPLTSAELLGTEADGSLTPRYCIHCYRDGAFTYDCTMSQMVDICVEHMVYPGSGFTAEQARRHMQDLLPRLDRWKASPADTTA